MTFPVTDPITQTYLYLIFGLLALAGIVIFILSVLLKKEIGGVIKTYRGWLIMAPLAVACVLGGRFSLIAGITLLSLAGFREYSRGVGLMADRVMCATVYLGIIAMGVICALTDPRLNTPGWYGLFMALPVYVVGFILIIPVIKNTAAGQLKTTSLAVTGFIYFGWMFGHLAFLANAAHAAGYLFFLLFAVEVNDISAFLMGKLFGKRKFRSEISPNKTWAGATGALAVSLVMPFLLQFSLPHFEIQHLIMTGLVVGIGGQLGDLTISYIKRDLGIKDMGSAIPGHGGILDRIDSLIFVAPLFFHMTRFFYGLDGQAL